jgi:hypothetical protein
MVKGLILAALLSAGATTASAEVVFVGTIKITAVTAQCQNVHVNDTNPSTFHPKIAGNSPFSGLSWVGTYSARGHALNNAAFDATFRTVKTGGVGWGDAFIAPQATWAQIRVTSYSPALGSINASTPTVTLRGQIKRLFDDPGGSACIATFVGTYVEGARF